VLGTGSDVLVELAPICYDREDTVELDLHHTVLAVMPANHSSVCHYLSRKMSAPETAVERAAVGMMHERYEVTDRKAAYRWRMKHLSLQPRAFGTLCRLCSISLGG
jgi:hypothetical protein